MVPLQPVEQQPDFPELERRVLARWRDRNVFHRSLETRADGPLFSFYEGPPTANGRPGVHHVESRAFKDVFPRYRTMKGYRVPRKGGWDCHGIPVEIEVEKTLGFTRKSDIEAYGVAAFNAKCRESVQQYVDDWNRLTERIGFWVDLDDAYWTMSTSYVESVWWSLKQLWDDGLIYQGHRVVPYCPRCGTALSDHEVAQGYARTVDPSVYVRLPVSEGPLAEQGASLLVWTTTPWTLISNTAVAIGEDISYVVARAAGDDFPVVMAADLVDTVLGEDATIEADVSVDDLRGVHYRAPFTYVLPEEPNEGWWSVTVADFVTTTDGTGIVHMAPAFGEDDMRVAREYDLPVINPVDLEGNFDQRVTAFAGQFVKAADADIIEALREKGVLFKAGEYTHTYPFCWRCKTPLLYYAKPSWYIATTQRREALLQANAGVDWHPEHIRDGRYGDWLANNIDWSLSRERYWGTPLPLWRCGTGHVTCVGSRDELGKLADADLTELDPHRPYVDDVVFGCPECGEAARRVPEVIDAWYDSGSMPFAQFGYPHAAGSTELFRERFPADFICEAIDQTRGWFYSLMAASTLLFEGQNSYRTVLCLGHIVDADGRKMSKSLGNILDPWDLVESKGADALRWLLLTEGSPWISRRVGTDLLDEVTRKFLLTVWNTYYFFVTYARIDGWTPDESNAAPAGQRPVMDRWILAELADTVSTVDSSLDGFDSTGAGRAISGFVDDLSNWYVRRSRSRFWADAGDARVAADKDAAFATLHECLVTLSALMAPLTPFIADELYENLVLQVDTGAPDSVHLLDFPTPHAAAADDELRASMTAARRIVELGRRARNDSRVGVRQPLQRALVTLPADERAAWNEVADVVSSELNVKQMELAEGRGGTVTYRLKPNFRTLGPTFGKRTPVVARSIAAADGATVTAELAETGAATVDVEGEAVTVTVEQVQIIEESETGWQSATDGPYGVALDLTIDDALRREGVAREAVRALNDLRKRRGLALSDRVTLRIHVTGAAAEALRAHEATIRSEVLAVDLIIDDAAHGQPPGETVELSDRVSLKVGMEVVPR
ncbi:MAG: isoleucine--tRNA ligase [Nitriliruptorales bacterium]|nr:isoleucine--tRNA ligase [Nitriliruptorales bacterium]